MSSQINELRMQAERLGYDNKESGITIDILKDQARDAQIELEEIRKQLADLKSAQKDSAIEDKEKRKQEKMALMMAKFDAVRFFSSIFEKKKKTFNPARYSKEHSPRRRNSSDIFFPNWIASIHHLL